MKSFAILMLLVILSFSNANANANGKTITPGEYRLAFSQSTDSKLVKNAFSEFGVVYVLPLGPNIYLMRLNNDPGKNRAESIARSIPNFNKLSINNVYKLK